MKKMIFSSLIIMAFLLSSCERTVEFSSNVRENSLFFYEYKNYNNTGYSLWMIFYAPKKNIILPSATNPYKTLGVAITSDTSVYVKVEKKAPESPIIVTKLPILYSDYGKFIISYDQKDIYNGLYYCDYKYGELEKLFIGLNQKTGMATIYFFKNKRVLKKKYVNKFDSNFDLEILIENINGEDWIISKDNNVRNKVITIKNGEKIIRQESLVMIDDKGEL